MAIMSNANQNKAVKPEDSERIKAARKVQLIPEIMDFAMKRYADRPAFSMVLPNGASAGFDFSRLDELSNNFAVYLREELKLQKGDVVAVMAPNCLTYPIALFGILKAGLIATNINPLYTEPEMQHQISDSKAKAIVIIDMFSDRLDNVIANTDLKHVVKFSIVEFFPTLKKLIIGAVLKYVKRQVPDLKAAHVHFSETLAKGKQLMESKSIDVKSYLADTKTDDVAIYQYTGGTTGRSKGAMLTHKNIVTGGIALSQHIESRLDEAVENVLMVLPMYHIYAFILAATNTPFSGNNVVLIPNPRPLVNIKPAFEQFNISVLPGINTLYTGLLSEQWFLDLDHSKFKLCSAGGAATLPATAIKWKEVTGHDIIEGYGLTETCAITTVNPVNGTRKIGSIGKPIGDVEIKLVDDDGNEVAQGEAGELICRGSNVMLGYLDKNVEADGLKDGWLYTGDVAVQDEEGYYAIVDRKKDMILVSGFNVYPNEIEGVISKINGILDVAAIGVPDDKTGEAIKVFISCVGDSVSEEIIMEECRKCLTNYKLPDTIEFREELPKTPVGKVLRKVLRDEEMAKA